MNSDIENIVKTHFANEAVDGIKLTNGRLIITLQKDVADTIKEAAMKEQLLSLADVSKVSVIYTAEKKPTSLKPREEGWMVKNVK